MSSLLAIGLMSTLGLGLLTWYYAQTLTRPSQVQHAAQAAAKNRAQGEMPLPPLGRIESPLRACARPRPLRPRRPSPLQWRRCSDLRRRCLPHGHCRYAAAGRAAAGRGRTG